MMIAILLSIGSADAAGAQALPPPSAVAGDNVNDTRLKRLFYDSDEASLKIDPVSAIFRGDLRYADRLGEYLSDKYDTADREAALINLANLHKIKRAELSRVDQIAYDVFENSTVIKIKGYSPDVWKVQRDLPLDHFSGFQTFYPHFASGKGAAPFKTVVDYENNLKRNFDYARLLGRAINRFKQGIADGIVEPKIVVTNMIGQFDSLINEGVEGSTFYRPVLTISKGISSADQVRLTTAYAAQIKDVIIPAETRIRDFLIQDYLPAARDSDGLSAIPGGDKLYAYLIERETTLPLSAAEVHQLGLNEVARITQEIEAQQKVVGFNGTVTQFFAFLRTDPRFQPKSSEQLHYGYSEIEKSIYRHIPEQFSHTPKGILEIRSMSPLTAKTGPNGSYEDGSPDGSRPGVFFYNDYNLPSRYLWQMETLFLHEAVPGHHFQISLAQENTALPAFMRFGGNTAYVEGWALYAESLWHELGLETDPYERLGGLNDELQRSLRVVVDSGIHSKGWSRDKAINYMLANSPMARTSATAEVERYIAIPGQALAYKVGQLTIAKAKLKAMKELGPRFDPRDFHTQVLETGALPMPVLEQKVDAWIAVGGGPVKP